VQKHLKRGSDVNAANDRGETPLHVAAHMGETEAAKLLVEHGADVNAKDELGGTPLHEAAKWPARTEVVKLLLANGADADAKNREGKTPLDVASRGKLKALLRKHMQAQK